MPVAAETACPEAGVPTTAGSTEFTGADTDRLVSLSPALGRLACDRRWLRVERLGCVVEVADVSTLCADAMDVNSRQQKIRVKPKRRKSASR